MNEPNFSVALIARNESKTLPRLVASLKEFTDRGGEIIVTDTGSTDGTPDVARSLGCKVIEVGDRFRITITESEAIEINEWLKADIVKAGDKFFDYASARNFSASQAKNDMIMMCDCDEIWTAFELPELEKLVAEGYKRFNCDYVFAHDKEGRDLMKFGVDNRFYDRRYSHWKGQVHETCNWIDEDHGIYRLHPKTLKLEHFQNKETERYQYLPALAYVCWKDPENDRNAHYFGRELYYHKKYDAARYQLEKHIKLGKWDAEAGQSMIYIGDSFKEQGNWEEASKWYLKAYEKDPTRREPLMRLAEYYYYNKLHTQAIIFAEAALKISDKGYYHNYQPYYTNLPHEILYWGYWHLDNKEKSREHFDHAFACCPNGEKYIKDRPFYYKV